tara:strand:- start:1453 stop:1650 length:198 start_codon:yes stop_codon:yes gene_type:complete
MTPKEKAEELVHKFYWRETIHNTSIINSKRCALIAVDEIEKALTNYDMDLEFRFWEQVKQEIEKL